MEMQTFWREVEKIADEFNIGQHSLAQGISEGKASSDQIKQFAIEHYEMTVRDSGPYIAQGYCNMARVDALALTGRGLSCKEHLRTPSQGVISAGLWPGLRNEAPKREAVRIEERDQDNDPALAKDTDQA